MITRRTILVSAMVLGFGVLLYFLHGSSDDLKPDLSSRPDPSLPSDLIDAQLPVAPDKVTVPPDNSPLSAKNDVATAKQRRLSPGVSGHATAPDAETIFTTFVFGRVVDVGGLPIQDTVVTEGEGIANTRTDDEGRYRLAIQIPTNTYPNLAFFRTGYVTQRMTVTNVDFDDASEIRLDVVLGQSSETMTVSGSIGSTAGRSIQGALIRLSKNPMPLYYSAVSDVNGEFSFEGVRYGAHYRLAVDPVTPHRKHAVEDVAITPDMPPLRIVLEPLILSTISGTIVGRDGNVIPKLAMIAHSRIATDHDVRVTSDSIGRFELRNFPVGEVSFSTSAPPNIRVNGIEVTQSLFQNITVPVDIGSYLISGWVADSAGIPISGARMILDASHEIGDVESSSSRTAITDSEGYFEFRQVGAGAHHISIHARGYAIAGAEYDVGGQNDQLYFNLSSLAGQ